MSSAPMGPAPALPGPAPVQGPTGSTSIGVPKRIFLMSALGILVALAFVASVPETIAADGNHHPRALQSVPGLIVDPTINHLDPSILWDPAAHVYRMYTSDSWNDGSVPEYDSKKVTGPWTDAGNVLPTLPSWEGGRFQTWAPEVADINGVWTLWGSTSDGNWEPAHTVVCPYRATAKSPAGPFVVDPVRPPCDLLLGGTIDPSPFKIGNQWWLVDKSNGNPEGLPCTFYTQRIGPDGEVTGPRYPILTTDLPWESGLIEAPNFVESPEHQWWLIFSAGSPYLTGGPPLGYRIAAVPCQGPEGRCDESGLTILVQGNQQSAGPGEQTPFLDRHGQWWLAYNPDGPLSTIRPLLLAKLNFDGAGIPYVSKP
jgi:hypothetical protein